MADPKITRPTAPTTAPLTASASQAYSLRKVRRFVTPEGVDLRLQIGDASQRVGAFLLDAGIILLVLVGLTIAAFLAGIGAAGLGGVGGVEMVAVIWLLIAFLLRNFYFTGFELTAAAATPGKRIMGLRVASRDGGRLRAESVFARNAMRELELFLPLSLLFSGVSGGGGVGAWIYLLTITWAAIFVFFPLFSRDRLRTGDLIGGTWVVVAPKQRLLADMAGQDIVHAARYAFTQEQLDAYGAKELHVLEDVLRQRDRKTMRIVAERISAKIGWSDADRFDDEPFLAAYYAGLRGRLETRLLMGVRRRDKHDV